MQKGIVRRHMAETSSSRSEEIQHSQENSSCSSWSDSRDTSEEELSDSSEDEYAKKLTKKLTSQIATTYHLLKTKDPTIYDERAQFYTDETEESEEDKESDDDDEPVAFAFKVQMDNSKVMPSKSIDNTKNLASIYDPEQVKLKREISSIMDTVQQNSDDDEFLTKKQDVVELEEKWTRTIQDAERNQNAEEYLLHSYLEKEKPDEAEQFLRDYILNDGWIKNINEAPIVNGAIHNIEIDEQDEEFLEKQEDFEATWNFRFEEPNSTEIVSYGRSGSSSRLKESKRKRKKARHEMRKKEKKENKRKDWEPQKKEKKEKILNCIKELLEFCKERGISYFELVEKHEDVDAKQHEQKIRALLHEEADSVLKKCLESKGSGNSTTGDSEDCHDKLLQVDRLIDEYFELELEDIVDDIPIRYRYRPVEPETFGLDTTDILEMDENELNRLVPLNYVTSYVQPKGVSQIRKQVKRLKKRKRISPYNKTFSRNHKTRKESSAYNKYSDVSPKKSSKDLKLSTERMEAYGLKSV